MRRSLSPSFRLAGRLHSVPNILAIAERRFAEQTSVRTPHFHAVTGIRARLLSANIQFHRAIDNRPRRFIVIFLKGQVDRDGRAFEYGGLCKPTRLQIFQHAFPAALAPESAFAISSKATRRVEKI